MMGKQVLSLLLTCREPGCADHTAPSRGRWQTLVNPKWAFQTPKSLTLDGNIEINSADRSVGDRASFYVQSTKSNPVP